MGSNTLSQADKRYAFLESVYASVAVAERNDAIESGGEEASSDDTVRRSVKGKEKTVVEVEKVEEEGMEKKGEENAEQSAWNLEEEGFDDI